MANNERYTEEHDGDNIVFRLMVDDKEEVCSARILPFSLLLNIHTAPSQGGKGYAKKLLSHIEKIAQENNVKAMQTSDIDPCDFKAVCFFKSLGYTLTPIKDDDKFLEGKKELGRGVIIRLIEVIERNSSKLFKKFDFLIANPLSFSLLGIVALFAFVLVVLALIITAFPILFPQTNIVITGIAFLSATIAFLSFTYSIYALIERFYLQGEVKLNYERLEGEVARQERALLMALVKLKAKNRKFSLKEIYDIHPEMFTKENLLEKLYE